MFSLARSQSVRVELLLEVYEPMLRIRDNGEQIKSSTSGTSGTSLRCLGCILLFQASAGRTKAQSVWDEPKLSGIGSVAKTLHYKNRALTRNVTINHKNCASGVIWSLQPAMPASECPEPVYDVSVEASAQQPRRENFQFVAWKQNFRHFLVWSKWQQTVFLHRSSSISWKNLVCDLSLKQ